MLSVQAPAFTFGSKPTNNSAQIRDAPGPADYSPTKSTKAPSYSLTGRNFVKEASSHGTPGPGAYSVKTTSKHTHKGPSPSVFSMGKRIPQGGKYTPNPGPADYSLDRTFKGTTGSPRFSPDKHSRRGNAGKGSMAYDLEQTPGPGSYKVSAAQVGGPKYSIRSRLSEKAKASNSPGPAAYSVRGPAASGPTFSLGSAKRFSKSNPDTEDTPGPGEYAANGGKYGPAFTIQSRVSNQLQSRANQEPGPCSYSPNFSVKKSAPAFSLGGKQANPELKGNKVPGPGHYACHNKSVDKQGSTKSKSFTMGSRTKTKTTSNSMNPGPAQYNSKGVGKKSAPAFTISPRYNTKTFDDKITPGPCEYKPSTSNLIRSPYYSFGMKLK